MTVIEQSVERKVIDEEKDSARIILNFLPDCPESRWILLEKTIFLDLPFNASQCVDILLEASTAMLRWQIVSIDRVQNSLLWKVSGYDFTGHKFDWAKVRASCLEQNSGGCAIELKVTSGGLLDIRDELGKLLRPFATSIENVAKVKQEAREAEEKELKKGIVCPTCKAEIESGMRFCPQDGTPIGNICIHCNTWNAPEANFCSGCGSRIL